MNKKLMLLGALAFVLGIIFAYVSGQQFLSNLSTPNNTHSGTIGMSGNTLAYLNFTVSGLSFFSLAYNGTNTLNFYLANQSAFYSLEPYFNSTANLSIRATDLEGSGVFAIINDSAVGVIPYSSSYSAYFPAPTYIGLANSTFLPTGTYFMLFKNPSSLNSTVFFSYYTKSASSVSVSGSGSFGFGLVSGLLLIVGVALVAFGAIAKTEKSEKVRASEEQIAKMYENIEKKPARAKAKKVKRHRK